MMPGTNDPFGILSRQLTGTSVPGRKYEMKGKNKVQKGFINSFDYTILSMAGPALFVEGISRWKLESGIPVSLFQ